MSYATIDDVTKSYKPLLDLIGSMPEQVSSFDVGSVYIHRAESLVDAFVGKRYSVPLASPPAAIITQITSDLSISMILMERQPDVPDFFQPRYDRAMELLKGISSGDLHLSSVELSPDSNQEAWSSTEDFHPVFSPVLDPIDQAVDKEQVDAAKDIRVDDL